MARLTRAAARRLILVPAILFLAVATSAAQGSLRPDEEQLEGRAPTAEELLPSVEAAFDHESYAPGDTARLVMFNSGRGVTVQIFQSGPERRPTVGNDELQGIAVTGVFSPGRTRPGKTVSI